MSSAGYYPKLRLLLFFCVCSLSVQFQLELKANIVQWLKGSDSGVRTKQQASNMNMNKGHIFRTQSCEPRLMDAAETGKTKENKKKILCVSKGLPEWSSRGQTMNE